MWIGTYVKQTRLKLNKDEYYQADNSERVWGMKGVNSVELPPKFSTWCKKWDWLLEVY